MSAFLSCPLFSPGIILSAVAIIGLLHLFTRPRLASACALAPAFLCASRRITLLKQECARALAHKQALQNFLFVKADGHCGSCLVIVLADHTTTLPNRTAAAQVNSLSSSSPFTTAKEAA
ncbi:hypothetical protein BDZ88DRAFT_416876 [Geranomyces variabilis]|nr:hypothetical protein BDZ88DRAFT_416876 [Geranomyces variabilis]